MTPRQEQADPTDEEPNPPVPGPDTQAYPGRIVQISQTLTNMIPGLTIYTYNYMANIAAYTQQYQGKALFEYDPNADGPNSRPNFRLWYEQTTENGRALGLLL